MAEKEGVAENTTGVEVEDEEESEEEAEVAAWVAPTEAEYKATLAKLNRSRTQAKTERLAAEAAKAALAAASAAGGDGAPAGIDPKVLEQAQTRVVRSEARARLLQEKIDPEMLDLALGLLRPSEIAFLGDDPDLDEWIDTIKEKHPKLFVVEVAQTGGRQPVGTVNQGAAGRVVPRKLSFGEQVLAASKAKR